MPGKKRRIVSVNVNHGEPVDGTGRVCIHLFVQDTRGSYVEPCAIHPVFDEDGNQVKQQVTTAPTRGRLACNPKRVPTPVTIGDAVHVTPRTDDPRAVTCPKCMASTDYAEMSEKIALAEAAR